MIFCQVLFPFYFFNNNLTIIQFILHTEFSDEKIASLQNVDIERVKMLRKKAEKN